MLYLLSSLLLFKQKLNFKIIQKITFAQFLNIIPFLSKKFTDRKLSKFKRIKITDSLVSNNNFTIF
ncbi:hypothetical protein BN927_00917 [Lactococcus lactis subsp. lactis Dephy 1]|nr:hypothetical protein ATCC19435_2220 [Lactococcus lactis subsp. lactis]CDI46665.1 hypothetical protein BN927_00917 [Lactococcus lactis subsp. lactis Dephy 1]